MMVREQLRSLQQDSDKPTAEGERFDPCRLGTTARSLQQDPETPVIVEYDRGQATRSV